MGFPNLAVPWDPPANRLHLCRPVGFLDLPFLFISAGKKERLLWKKRGRIFGRKPNVNVCFCTWEELGFGAGAEFIILGSLKKLKIIEFDRSGTFNRGFDRLFKDTKFTEFELSHVHSDVDDLTLLDHDLCCMYVIDINKNNLKYLNFLLDQTHWTGTVQPDLSMPIQTLSLAYAHGVV